MLERFTGLCERLADVAMPRLPIPISETIVSARPLFCSSAEGGRKYIELTVVDISIHNKVRDNILCIRACDDKELLHDMDKPRSSIA